VPRATIAACASTLALLVVIGDGCSSSSGGAPPCTVTPPAQDAFCTAVADYDSHCGHCTDCTAQNIEYCDKLSAASSDAYRAAFIACKDTASCSGPPAFTACVLRQMLAVAPTPVQAQAKTAYCTSCMTTNQSDCNGFFSIDPSSGKTGAGYNVLLANDALVNQAITTCSSMCDPLNYALCVAFMSCHQAGGDHCADGGFCAPQ
jgi:hypothetical protein